MPFAVHTTNKLPRIDQVMIDGFRTTSATRTVLDLAHARTGQRRIEAAIDSAVRLGLSSPQAIARRLETLRGSGRWGCRLIEELVVDSGGHSMLERRFLELVRTSGLPRPVTQAVQRKGSRFVARVDFLFPEVDVVIEVSGQHGHSSPVERKRDAQRRNELQDLGFAVYEYTWAEVTQQRIMVQRTLRQRLDAAA
jgi:very-short-patch-repair endonuclease